MIEAVDTSLQHRGARFSVAPQPAYDQLAA